MFRDSQLISITGAIRHSLLWITASSNDVVYQNPSFRPTSPTDKGTAIYCIHGTADRNYAFSLIAERLLPQLPDTISSIHLVVFDQRLQGIGIVQLAIQLKNKISANQHQRIDLWGHSRGGLVAAYFAEYLAAANNIHVQSIFTIGTPFGGSSLAMAPLTWLSTSVAQMRPDNAFLTALNSKVIASSIPYFYFAAANDALVCQRACCPAAHLDRLVTLDRHGHLSIMSSHRLVSAILVQLQRYAIIQSSEAGCLQKDIEETPLNIAAP